MVFSSFVFLFGFLPLLLVLYFLVPGQRAKNALLLIFSLLFYAWGEPVGVAVLLIGVSVGWIGGRFIGGQPRTWRRKAVFCTCIAMELALLLHFKYAGFLLNSLGSIMGVHFPEYPQSLPIGISFFTFHTISYLADVYREQAPPLRSFSKLLLYISLFPQLVAGPIVRYADVREQLYARRVTSEGFAYGIARFAIGLGKKVIFANSLSELTVIFLDGGTGLSSVLGAWFGILAFALQIYFDFSGYSDMAIGLGRMFGFTFKENFDYPYISRSMTEFWRRWNISVGSFFRDYVYIPMGGNRRRPLFNLLAVWGLTGLWHGASWNFVLWGLYFGVLIALEKSFLVRLIDSAPMWSRLYFMVGILAGWVLFYFTDFARGFAYLRTLFGFAPVPWWNEELLIQAQNQLLLLLAALIAATPYPKRLHAAAAGRLKPRLAGMLYANAFLPAASFILLVLCTLLLVGKTYTPFFYFRF
jgi:alginate O-acetyltransferase complex protein AlgI